MTCNQRHCQFNSTVPTEGVLLCFRHQARAEISLQELISQNKINSPLVTPLFTLNPPVTPILESSKLRDTTCWMKQDFITHTTYLISPLSRGPWEANRFSANQEIPRIVWSPKIHYHIYKSPLPPVPVLRQISLVHAPPPTSHFVGDPF
jgi:hypothetical protein